MLRLSDLDLKLPTTDDFRCPDVAAMTFCAMAHLCVQISRIEQLGALSQEATPAEISSFVNALQEWIEKLQPELRLFDAQGQRLPWSRLAAELHIFYFVSIIVMYLLPGPHRHAVKFCISSIIASSCAARLYEEILHREEVLCLLSIHGWANLVSAVPQFYCGIKFPHYSAVCAEELSINRAVLTQMRDRYPSADVVLRKIDSLPRTDTIPNPRSSAAESSSRTRCSQVEGLEDFGNTQLPDVAALFPFPDSLSPKMGLLPPQASSEGFDASADVGSPTMQFDLDSLSWPLDMSAFSLANLESLFPSEPGFQI
ncbi:hypothetical protein SLS56_010789 [Neofusicoccum ribis]|uniref:C6 transcription factor n=1 Tax=Neofusicoccum ribis TaxID=45134 RepID=A0ABR3SEB7_9PEZI